jgi:hypothetical protein
MLWYAPFSTVLGRRHIMGSMGRLTLGNVLIAWFVFLLGSAFLLPPIGSRAPVHPILRLVLFLSAALLLVATPVTAVKYFKEAWRKVGSVPNRTSYIVWLGLETSAAVGVLGLVVYLFIHRR